MTQTKENHPKPFKTPKNPDLGPRVPKTSKSGQNLQTSKSGQNPKIPKSGPGPQKLANLGVRPGSRIRGFRGPRDPGNGQISGSPGPFFFWPGPQISLKFPNLHQNPGPYLWIQLKPSSRKVCFFPGSGTPENPDSGPRKPGFWTPGRTPRFARFRPDPGSGRNWDPPWESPKTARSRKPRIPGIPGIPRIPEKL